MSTQSPATSVTAVHPAMQAVLRMPSPSTRLVVSTCSVGRRIARSSYRRVQTLMSALLTMAAVMSTLSAITQWSVWLTIHNIYHRIIVNNNYIYIYIYVCVYSTWQVVACFSRVYMSI